VLDCATVEPGRDPLTDLDTIEAELAAYEATAGGALGGIPLSERPRIVALNKIDVPEARDLADLVRTEIEARGLPVYEVSAATTEGLREFKFALAEIVTQARLATPAAEPVRVIIRPPAVRDDSYEIVRTDDGSYLIRGDKPSRWVNQTDFTNDEAVGYLADRLARLGVEEALAKAGAEAGDTVLIGDLDDAVVFDWDPELPAGSGHAPGPRGSDWRLER
jgi:GTPase